MPLENALNVPERHGAILYGDGRYQLFFADIMGLGFIKSLASPSFEVTQKASGSDYRNLKTSGIISCAGVMYQNGPNYVLLHAYGRDNLKELLNALNPLSIADAKQYPKHVDLCTPNWLEDYSSTIKESFEQGVKINAWHKRRFMVLGPQNMAIGKDTHDIGYGANTAATKEAYVSLRSMGFRVLVALAHR